MLLAQKARDAAVYLNNYIQMEADALMKASEMIRSGGAAPAPAETASSSKGQKMM